MNLLATKEWVSYFRDHKMEWVDNRIFEIFFVKEIKGNRVNYTEILNSINDFAKCFDWLKIYSINLCYSEEIEDFHNLRDFDKKNGISLEIWEQNVIQNLKNAFIPVDAEYDNLTFFHYNYSVQFNHQIENLFKPNYFNGGQVMIVYYEDMNTTFIEIGTDIREDFFTNKALDNDNQYTLSENHIKQNISILKSSISKMVNLSYRFECQDDLKRLLDINRWYIALQTSTGKILKENGFDGVPEIIRNTEDEVIIYFNPQWFYQFRNDLMT